MKEWLELKIAHVENFSVNSCLSEGWPWSGPPWWARQQNHPAIPPF